MIARQSVSQQPAQIEPAQNQPESKLVCLGVIVAAQGLRGEVKIKVYGEAPESLVAYGPLQDAGGRRITLRGLRAARGGAVATIEGVSDRNAAEALKGAELFVVRAALPDPSPEEYYHADLIGLAVFGIGGEALGRVSAVHNFGAGDILEITAPGSGSPSLMVPFQQTTVPHVDLAAGRVSVDLATAGAGFDAEAKKPSRPRRES
jgi:16S rRNA processing protein RimM